MTITAPSPSSSRRSCETYSCTIFGALAGGCSPQRPSARRSADTVRPAWSASIASTARCLGAPSAIGPLVEPRLDRPKEAQIHAERRRSGHAGPTLLPVETRVNRVSTASSTGPDQRLAASISDRLDRRPPCPSAPNCSPAYSPSAWSPRRSPPRRRSPGRSTARTSPSVPTPSRVWSTPRRPRPTRRSCGPIDAGFDWGSAAIGAGGAGALVVLITLGGFAFTSRHRIGVAR